LAGPQAGTDKATYNATCGYLDHGRPIFPALFITDITDLSNSTAGDWQQGGISPFPPNAVYGTWKGAVRTVDQTQTPAQITVTPDSDPAQNFWSFIPDVPPNGFGSNQGFGAELVWNADSLGLVAGHTYRLQLMLHDGDQNQSGGDAGEGCVQVVTSTLQ